MKPDSCLYCYAPSRKRRPFLWRGYYRFRCANGHNWQLATPKQAAANWVRLRNER